MSSTSRATLPAEFFDITSDMLLVQPEPMYIYAAMWKASIGAGLSVGTNLGLQIGNREFGANGAAYTMVDRDRLMLSEPIMVGGIKAIPELGKGPGQTVRINRPAFTNTTYTQASREVPSGNTISTVGVAVQSEQTSVTLKRFAGIYDSVNSRVAPLAIERFDSSVSLHSMAQIHGLTLKRDFDKTVDSFFTTLLDSSAVTTIWPKGVAADVNLVTPDAGLMDWNTISRTEKDMDDGNIPTFGDGKRVMVLRPAQTQQLSDDVQFARYAEKHPVINPVLNPNYWKTAGNFHIFKSTTLTVDTSTVAGVSICRGHAFGPGVLGSGVGRLPEVVYATDDNYGETAKVIWVMYSGFQLLDSRFARQIHTSS